MIVTLSQEVCRQLREIDRIETIQKNSESISATLEALISLKASTEQIVTLITLLRKRLPSHSIQNMLFIVNRLQREIKESREHFETELRQKQSLSNISTSVQKMIKEVKLQWEIYAREQMREPLELLNLVKNLPEVEAQQAAYDELKRDLERYAKEPPLTSNQLTDFDQSINRLTQRLNSIDGINAEVKVFLQKTLKGEATLADLTDEVLQWCRQGDHASIFAVRFAR